MSFLKKIRRKGGSNNHQALPVRASVPSPTLECAKDKYLSDKEETIREESRRLSPPKSLQNFRKEKRNGNVTRGAACSTEATKANTALLAPLSDAVGDDETKKERKAKADIKGDRPQVASCQSRNKNKRSGATTVSSRAPPPPPPTSSKPSVSQPGPSQSSSSRLTPVRPAPPPPRRPRTRPARPPPPSIKQSGKNSGTASQGPSSDKEKDNKICQYPRDLNPFANSNSNTDDDCSSQKSEKASSTRRQRHKKRRKNSKSGEYPTENNPFNDADEMSEKLSSTRRQRRRRKRKESKNEECPMEDNSSSDTDQGSSSILESTESSDMWSVSSLEDIQVVVNIATKEKENVKTPLQVLAANDEKDEQVAREDSAQSFPSGKKVSREGSSSSILESTETSDLWSFSSLEDIQFVVNTAAVEEVNMKTALLSLAANNESDGQVDRKNSGESSAQSFPSGKEVSSVDLPSTNKDNDFESIRSTNLDASTTKDFTDVDERPILRQAKPTEEASSMEESQGGDSCAFSISNQCPELAIYVEAELQVVESEMLSLQKVMVKLELEMKEAMDSEDCEAEFESLSLDWLALNKFGSELDQRKQDLLTLSKQENRKECLKFVREDLKCLFEVKGWKKTSEHKAQEKNVLDLILKLTNMV